MMKSIAVSLCLVGLLTGCYQASAPDLPKTSDPDPVNCPDPPASLPYINLEARGYYNAFDYQILKIEAEADTVTFLSGDRNFIYCRGDGSWTIQPGTYTKAAAYNYFTEPSYQTIQLNDQSYQYRVRLEPTPTRDSPEEPQQVVFELIPLNQEQPIRQVLYTLEQAQLETAISLGVPQVSAALTYDNRLFWAVSPEQGEGNGGVATIVGYDPQTENFEVIQPEEINNQQINDLVIAGEPDTPTFWIATQVMGEGNPYLPGMGLVAYRPDTPDYQTGSVDVYYVGNSPLVGAIPTALKVEDDRLWVGTGNGVCQVQWQTANNPHWNCWRFALMSELPESGVPLYKSSVAQTSQTNLAGEMAEVLWWTPQSYEEAQGRYEVRYDEGFTVTLESGASLVPADRKPWNPPVYWAGWQWHWDGKRFERGFDEVSLSEFGGGPSGISLSQADYDTPFNHYAIRGDLELLKLTQNTTEVKYYSGWVDDDLLKPYLTVVPQEKVQNPEPNPLEAMQRVAEVPSVVATASRSDAARSWGSPP